MVSRFTLFSRLQRQYGSNQIRYLPLAALFFFFQSSPLQAEPDRYTRRIGRDGYTYRESTGSVCDFPSHRYIGLYPSRHLQIPVRTGRYGTYRPIFKSMNYAKKNERHTSHKSDYKSLIETARKKSKTRAKV
ncbi:hypothetical protein RHMOL_Rhmol06G0238500 [Rhododendron molle]|uniref:Uncharacterized protein n=1 Tax=Rhododendron molle TaxID=49168 RepID=A0ACC0NFR3_RHOML|nr:hypothetical protein RHMOL_Rhmol06G0238500 [Rhododendron molle]